MKQRILFICIAIISSFWAEASVRAQSNDEIRLGAIVSLTGIAANYGQNVRRGLELGVESLRAEGVNVHIVFEDDQTDPKSTVTAFKKLAGQKVEAILGATWAFTTNAAIPQAASLKIPLISTSNLPESLNLAQGAGYAFNIGSSIETEAAPFKRYLDREKPKSATVLYDLTSWGELQRKYFRQILETHKIEVLSEIESPSKGVNSWAAIVAQIKNQNPELLALLLDPQDIQLVVKGVRELKLSAGIFASINTYEAWKYSQPKTQLEGVCFTYPLEQLHFSQEFWDSFVRKYGSQPEACTDSSYDGVRLLANLIQRARQEHRPLVDVLRSTTYKGILGQYQYSEKGSLASGKGSLVCVRNGEVKVE